MAAEVVFATDPLALTASARHLGAAVTRVRRAAGHRAGSATEAVLLDGRDGQLALAVMHPDLAVTTTIECTLASPGVVAFDGAQLADVLKRTGGYLALRGTRLACNGIEHTLALADHPPAPAVRPPTASLVASVAARDLHRMLRRGAYCMSSDVTRPQLCGALLERTDGMLRVVATDGHRLAAAGVASPGIDFEILVPRAGIDALGVMIENLRDETVRVYRSAERAWFVWPGHEVSTRVVTEVVFPAWPQVVPPDSPARITIPRRDTLDAVRALAGRRDDAVHFELGGSAERITLRTVTAVAEVTALKEGSLPRTVALNARYVRELLQSLDDDYGVEIQFGGELDPVKVVAPFDTVSVLMPMRA